MTLEAVKPCEEYDLVCFQSLPLRRWRAGVLKMGWGKARVRIAPVENDGWVPIDYWGGDHESAFLILGFLLAMLNSLPEEIGLQELIECFPEQHDKDTGPQFWRQLFQADARVLELYGDFQE